MKINYVNLGRATNVSQNLYFSNTNSTISVRSRLYRLNNLRLRRSFLQLRTRRLGLFSVERTRRIRLSFFNMFARVLVNRTIANGYMSVTMGVVGAIIVGQACNAQERILLTIISSITRLRPTLTCHITNGLVLRHCHGGTSTKTQVTNSFLGLQRALGLLFRHVNRVRLSVLNTNAKPNYKCCRLLSNGTKILTTTRQFGKGCARGRRGRDRRMGWLTVIGDPFYPINVVYFVI